MRYAAITTITLNTNGLLPAGDRRLIMTWINRTGFRIQWYCTIVRWIRARVLNRFKVVTRWMLIISTRHLIKGCKHRRSTTIILMKAVAFRQSTMAVKSRNRLLKSSQKLAAIFNMGTGSKSSWIKWRRRDENLKSRLSTLMNWPWGKRGSRPSSFNLSWIRNNLKV